MKKFDEWMQIRENNTTDPTMASEPNRMNHNGDTPLAQAATGTPSLNDPSQQIDNLKGVRQQIKTLLERLFGKFESSPMAKGKAIQLLQLMIQEFQTDFNLSGAQVRQAQMGALKANQQVNQQAEQV